MQTFVLLEKFEVRGGGCHCWRSGGLAVWRLAVGGLACVRSCSQFPAVGPDSDGAEPEMVGRWEHEQTQPSKIEQEKDTGKNCRNQVAFDLRPMLGQ